VFDVTVSSKVSGVHITERALANVQNVAVHARQVVLVYLRYCEQCTSVGWIE
jgi:hypothetical protein